MPYLLLVSGIVMVVSAVPGTYTDLIQLVSGEFKGSTAQSNFLYWIVAILIIGMIGYVESMKNFSRTVLALVIIVLLLHNSGFFAKFFSGIGTTQTGGSSLPTLPGLPAL